MFCRWHHGVVRKCMPHAYISSFDQSSWCRCLLTATMERANFRMLRVPLLYVHRLASAIVVCFLYIRLLKVQDLNSFVQRPANKIKREMLWICCPKVARNGFTSGVKTSDIFLCFVSSCWGNGCLALLFSSFSFISEFGWFLHRGWTKRRDLFSCNVQLVSPQQNCETNVERKILVEQRLDSLFWQAGLSQSKKSHIRTSVMIRVSSSWNS